MKTKEELEKIIAEAQQELKQLENKGLWKPANGEEYYFISHYGQVNIDCFIVENIYDTGHVSIGNYFKTEAEAQQHLENLKTKQQLKEIAFRLNDGMVIDWKDVNQEKYYLYLNALTKVIRQYNLTHTHEPSIYCLSPKLLDTALKEIGEERLINYLKGEA